MKSRETKRANEIKRSRKKKSALKKSRNNNYLTTLLLSYRPQNGVAGQGREQVAVQGRDQVQVKGREQVVVQGRDQVVVQGRERVKLFVKVNKIDDDIDEEKDALKEKLRALKKSEEDERTLNQNEERMWEKWGKEMTNRLEEAEKRLAEAEEDRKKWEEWAEEKKKWDEEEVEEKKKWDEEVRDADEKMKRAEMEKNMNVEKIAALLKKQLRLHEINKRRTQERQRQRTKEYEQNSPNGLSPFTNSMFHPKLNILETKE